jgi:hypothetical protein
MKNLRRGRMIIKSAIYSKCSECNCRKDMISSDIYGCDNCGKDVTENREKTNILELQIFGNHENAETRHYCNWLCLFKNLKTIGECDFITLPMLTFTRDTEKQTSIDAFKEMINKIPGVSND